IRDYGFYAQDQFLLTPKLTVNYGARYEYAQLPQPRIFNPNYPQTGHIATGRLNLAPRVGLAYSLNEKTVLRAGFGMFHARFPGSYIWSRGLQILAARDLNMGDPGAAVTYTINDANGTAAATFDTPVYLAANRVDPRYGRIVQAENGLNSYYNALAVQVNKRFS